MADEQKHGLIITRRPGQSVFIETDKGRVEVLVTATNNNRTRLLFACDRQIKIFRAELEGKQQPDENACGAV